MPLHIKIEENVVTQKNDYVMYGCIHMKVWAKYKPSTSVAQKTFYVLSVWIYLKVKKWYQPCTSVASSEIRLANSFITILHTAHVTEFLVLVIFVKAVKPLKASVSAPLLAETNKYILVLSHRPSLAQICDGSSFDSSHEMISGPYASMRDSQPVLNGNGRKEQRDSTASMISSWKWKWFETWVKQNIVQRKFFFFYKFHFILQVEAIELWFGVVINLIVLILVFMLIGLILTPLHIKI